MKKEQATEKLERQIGIIKDLMRKPRFSNEYKKWHRDTEVAIEHIFGKDTRHLNDFKMVSHSPRIMGSNTPDSKFEKAFTGQRKLP